MDIFRDSQLLLAYLNCLEVWKLTCYPGASKMAVAGCIVLVAYCAGKVGLCFQFIWAKGSFKANKINLSHCILVKTNPPELEVRIMVSTFGHEHHLNSRSCGLVFYQKYQGTHKGHQSEFFSEPHAIPVQRSQWSVGGQMRWISGDPEVASPLFSVEIAGLGCIFANEGRLGQI